MDRINNVVVYLWKALFAITQQQNNQ